MRLAIFGTGGVGGYFGGRLAAAGEDVTFIARGEHLRVIQTQGLRVQSIKGDFTIRPAKATDHPNEIGQVDVVILGVKAWQVPETANAIRPLIGPESVVLPLQNGVEASDQVSEVLGPGRVLGGLAKVFSSIAEPGLIRHVAGPGAITLGELDHRPSERTQRLQKAFSRAEIPADISPDIHVALWEKLVFVASFGGLSSVTRAPIGILRGLPETRQMLEQGMGEVISVARGLNVPLADEAKNRAMAMLEALPAAATPSLQRDIIAGRPSELEAWNGAVVRLGKKAGVSTPLNSFLYYCLLPLEQKARGELQLPM